MKPDIPFYKNPGTHCAQACLRMGYEFLTPERQWTWEALDQLTGHKPSLTTWNMKAYIETARLGYDVIVYDPINYQQFAIDPVGYISRTFSPAYAEETFRMSDMDQAVADAKELIEFKELALYPRCYELHEYKALLDQHYLCMTWVDMAITNHIENACEPHVILVYGYDAAGIWAHDPGYKYPDSAHPHRFISWDLFEKANKMNEQDERGEMMAFKNL